MVVECSRPRTRVHVSHIVTVHTTATEANVLIAVSAVLRQKVVNLSLFHIL